MTDSPTLIAIETATAACSVAVQHNGVVTAKREIGSNVHSQVLLAMLQACLAESALKLADVHAVAVGSGPGSFTGLRIGIGVAQGIAYGAGCDMLGVSSLDVLAYNAQHDGAVVAGIDARMGEIYWAEYVKQNNSLERLGALAVSAPDLIKPQHADCQWVGNAWSVYQSELAHGATIELPNEAQIYPHAQSLLALAEQALQGGETVAPIDFVPEYVRNDVAKKSTKAHY